MKHLQESTLSVEGMTCGHCVGRISGALRELEGVEKVVIDLERAKVKVLHDASSIDVSDLVRALDETGYAALPAAG